MLFLVLVLCGEIFLCNCRQLAVFAASKDSEILNIVFSVATSHMVAGTENGCFAWKLDAKLLAGHQLLSKRYVCLSCCLLAMSACY